MDGVAERLHSGQNKDAVLCAWGIDFDGKEHLLHLARGTKGDTESVREFNCGMKRRSARSVGGRS